MRKDYIHNVSQAENSSIQTNKDKIVSLLKSTGRENIGRLIEWLENHSFFVAPASKTKHNAFAGGLAKHSLDVFNEALRLNEANGLPLTSITICALLHDVCKADQFYMDKDGKPQRNNRNITKGHGLRSVFIVTRGCGVPLNYDEVMAIWWHMGTFENSKNKYPAFYEESKEIPLCQLIHQADGIAANCRNEI